MPYPQFLFFKTKIKAMFEPITSEMRSGRLLVSGRSNSHTAVKKFVDFTRSLCVLNYPV